MQTTYTLRYPRLLAMELNVVWTAAFNDRLELNLIQSFAAMSIAEWATHHFLLLSEAIPFFQPDK